MDDALETRDRRLRHHLQHLGIAVLERSWLAVAGIPLPAAVRTFVHASRNDDYQESDQPDVTDYQVARAARAAAQRLASVHSPGLDAQVEAALHAECTDQPAEQYLDPVSVSSLIVSVAALSWTIYKDLRSNAFKPARDVIAHRVRVELPVSDQIPPSERDRVIAVVVEEVVKGTDG
jgi:hypothetical protein